MKIRTPSLIGIVGWAVLFLAMLGSVFGVAIACSWHLAAGFGVFFLAALVLGLFYLWLIRRVGYVDTEFVLGLLLSAAVGLGAMTFFGKLHQSQGSSNHVSASHAPSIGSQGNTKAG